MDAKVWTVGATLFALLYLTLGVLLVWSAVVVALILAAWVMGLETEGPEGLKYVELELRPALAFVGIFALTVVILGPHFPPILSRSLYPVQYAAPLTVLHSTPVLFYFPLVPLITGSLMTMHQRFHPLQGLVYQTPPSPATRVHVHLHQGRMATRADDEEAGDDDEDKEEAPRHHRRHHPSLELRHRIRRARRWRASAADSDDEDDDGDDEERTTFVRHHRHHRAIRASESGEL